MNVTDGFELHRARPGRTRRVRQDRRQDRMKEVMTAEGDALYREICTILEKHVPSPAKLAPSTELSGDLNIDSVAAMDLIMEIEDKFGIDIPMNLVSDLRNLQDLVDVVRQQIEGR
jgi:acyl carrier protein